MNLIEKVKNDHQNWQFSIKFDDFWYKIEIRIQIWTQIQIEIIATIDRMAEFGSKKLIKSQFEYDLERISSRPRSNRISLMKWEVVFKYQKTRNCVTLCKIRKKWMQKKKKNYRDLQWLTYFHNTFNWEKNKSFISKSHLSMCSSIVLFGEFILLFSSES